MAKVRLKLIMEKGLAVGSCGTGIPERGTLEETKEEKAEIGSLLSWVRDTFGDRWIFQWLTRKIFSPCSITSATE